jgi:cell division protein ZapB
MQKELDSLAQKIQLASELCQRLRKENQNLRQELAAAQQKVKLMNARLDEAKTRVETLIDSLPAQ